MCKWTIYFEKHDRKYSITASGSQADLCRALTMLADFGCIVLDVI